MIYAINYDLKQPGQNYASLYRAIMSCGVTWHYLDSTWLVETSLDATGITNILAPHIDRDDSVLVIGVTRDYQGWLPKEAWQWINKRWSKMGT